MRIEQPIPDHSEHQKLIFAWCFFVMSSTTRDGGHQCLELWAYFKAGSSLIPRMLGTPLQILKLCNQLGLIGVSHLTLA